MEMINCFKCKSHYEVPGNYHIGCKNYNAKIKGNRHGIKNGWFYWPFLFDPIWLESCDSFEEVNNEKNY